MRQHQRFAEALKGTFVTQLKMKKLWEEYELKEDYIKVEFNPPNSFHALREQQIFEIKSGNFANMSANELISNTYCQKKYLDWTDNDVVANRAFLKKDKELAWELAQIEAAGPNWRDQAAAPGEEGMPGDMGGPMGGGSMLPPGGEGPPPDFGPPPDTGAEGDVPPETPPPPPPE